MQSSKLNQMELIDQQEDISKVKNRKNTFKIKWNI